MTKFWTNILPVLLVVMIGCLLYAINETDKETDRMNKDLQDLKLYQQSIEDSIQKLNALNKMYEAQINSYKDSLDTLSKVKQKIITKYRDQKDFVINSADVNQLDSVIRTNAGIGR
jgi:chromosome segregation ATPase